MTWLIYLEGGGNVEAIKFLLERGADPNKVGQFLRTPLYRAAFAGHLEACEVCILCETILLSLYYQTVRPGQTLQTQILLEAFYHFSAMSLINSITSEHEYKILLFAIFCSKTQLRCKACFTLIVRPVGRAFLLWVTERRGREADRRQFHTESHLT